MRRRELPPLPHWEHSISFTRIQPERNCYRGYTLYLTQDLFGQWALIRSWGRIGRRQRTRIEFYTHRNDAHAAAAEVGRRRLLHGYHITTAR